MTKKMRILFVDDEPLVLQVIKASMRAMAQEWEAEYVGSGHQALELMQTRPFDVVISDMKMPNMNGAELLNEVMRLYPGTIRIILSGFADESLVLQCIGATHQYLLKPFDLQAFRKMLKRLQYVHTHLHNPDIKRCLAGLTSVPTIPSVYFRIIEVLKQPNAPMHRMADLIASDPSLTAKLLHLVNSAFFGQAQRISSAMEAVQCLGIGRIRSLVLSLQVFSAFEHVKFNSFSMEEIWNHSLLVGVLAGKLAEQEGGTRILVEECFTAGLLHDLGKLVLAANHTDTYQIVVDIYEKEQVSISDLEQRAFGVTHADVGGYLLGLWGLPIDLVEAVALHHTPSLAAEIKFGPLTTVHLANHLAHESMDQAYHLATSTLDEKYLGMVGVWNKLDAYRQTLQIKR